MGNYSDFETDFVQRTLALIDQYNEMIEVQGKPFREQYNYTLTLNCLLGHGKIMNIPVNKGFPEPSKGTPDPSRTSLFCV